VIDHLCPSCGTEYHSEAQHLGKHLRCNLCQTVFRIERPTHPDEPSAYIGKIDARPQNLSTTTRCILAIALSATAGAIWLAHGPLVYMATLVASAAVAILVLQPRDHPKYVPKHRIWSAVKLQRADLALAAASAGVLLSLLQVWLQSSRFRPSDVTTVWNLEVGIVELRRYAGPLLSPGWRVSIMIAITLLGV
jgi:hypothetical protein